MTFERYLQSINPSLRIMEYPEHPDIDVLYWRDTKICSLPKGGKYGKWINMINDLRTRELQTQDKISHRSLNGVGRELLQRKLITKEQYVQYFTSEALERKLLTNL